MRSELLELITVVVNNYAKYTYGSPSIFLRLVEWMIKAIFVLNRMVAYWSIREK